MESLKVLMLVTAPLISEIVTEMKCAAHAESTTRSRLYQLSAAFINKFDHDVKLLMRIYEEYG